MARIAWGRGPSESLPQTLGAEVICSSAPVPPLRSVVLRLGMASGLNGVVDIAVVANPVVCGRALRERFAPSLLSRFGALGPWMDR